MDDFFGDMMLMNLVNRTASAQMIAEMQLRAQVDPEFAERVKQYYRQLEQNAIDEQNRQFNAKLLREIQGRASREADKDRARKAAEKFSNIMSGVLSEDDVFAPIKPKKK